MSPAGPEQAAAADTQRKTTCRAGLEIMNVTSRALSRERWYQNITFRPIPSPPSRHQDPGDETRARRCKTHIEQAEVETTSPEARRAPLRGP
jgi:hypothetical protein